MAFLAQSQADENQGNDPNQDPLIPTLAGSGASTSGSGGSGSATSAPASPGAAPSAPWANISSYLSANGPQGKQTADKIAGGFNQQYQDIQDSTNTASQNFTNAINQNTVGLDQNLFNSATSDPTSFAKDPNNVSAFKKAYGATYNGPTAFESTPDYANIQGKIQSGQKNAGLLSQGESGVQSLLQNVGHNATPGQNSLDSLLLQEDPGNYQAMAKAAAPFAGLNDFLSGKVSNLDQAARTAAGTTGQTAQTLQGAFTGDKGVIPTFTQTVQGRLPTAISAAQQRATEAAAALHTDKPTSQQLADLGLTSEQFNKMYSENAALPNYATKTPGQPGRLDLSSFLSQADPYSVLNSANVATPDDYAEAAALSQLTGQDMNSILDQKNASQGGTANLNLSRFDPSGLNAVDSMFNQWAQSQQMQGTPDANGVVSVTPNVSTPAIGPVTPGTKTSGQILQEAKDQAIIDAAARKAGNPNAGVVRAFPVNPTQPTPTDIGGLPPPTPAINTPLAAPKPAINTPLAPTPVITPPPPVVKKPIDPSQVVRAGIGSKYPGVY